MKPTPPLFGIFALVMVPVLAQAQKESGGPVPPVTSAAEPGWALSAGAKAGRVHANFSAIKTTEVEPDGDDSFVGGYLELSRELTRMNGLRVSLFGSYGFGRVSFATGQQLINEFEIADDEIYTLVEDKVEASLHQIELGLDLSADLGGGFEFGLAAGPTLTYVNADWEGTTEGFRESTLGFYRGGSNDATKTDLVFGAAAELRLRYNFPGDRLFLQVGAGYAWAMDADVSHAGVTAEIDPSTWTVSAGLGFRF
jgi:hypothetical protein